MPRRSGSARPRPPRTPKAKCCRRFRPQHVTDAEIEAAVAGIARRDRPGPVVGQRDQGRRPAGLQAGARGSHRRTGRRDRCASTGSTCCAVRRDDAPRRRRRRGRLLVGHLHPGAGARRRRDARGRRPPDGAAPHQGRPVRAGRGAHARRSGRTSRAELLSTRRACCCSRIGSSTDDEADSVANGRALSPAGIDGVYAAAHRRRSGHRTAARSRVRTTKSVVVIRPATL